MNIKDLLQTISIQFPFSLTTYENKRDKIKYIYYLSIETQRLNYFAYFSPSDNLVLLIFKKIQFLLKILGLRFANYKKHIFNKLTHNLQQQK